VVRRLLRLLLLWVGVRKPTDKAADKDLGEYEHEAEEDTGKHEATTGFGDVGLSGDTEVSPAPPPAAAESDDGGPPCVVSDDASNPNPREVDLARRLQSVMMPV
jgi:hypothetical protein